MKATIFLVLCSSAVAFGFDASLPDGSAGMGGADMTSEENDLRDPCLASRDCDNGFVCSSGRCVPAPVRNASGCGGGLAVTLLPMAALGLLVARRTAR